MKHNELDPAIVRQICFQPPYCPNEECSFHGGYPELGMRQFSFQGWATRVSHPYQVRCYRCLECKRGFRYSSFKLSYREKKAGLNSRIFRFFCIGASNREIARQLGISEHCVRGRLLKLSQWALLKHTRLTESLKIEEPIVYDGLEAFAKSQYDPNQIQHAMGKDSLFTYDFNFAPLNRKGRMSPRQKEINARLEEQQGRYDPKAIRRTSQVIFQRLHQKKAPGKPLLLYSDEHFQYDRAVQWDLKDCQIQHVRISSQISRNFKNHLFAVNHSDLLIRHHVAAFKRETISFSKTHCRMIQKYSLFMVYKNYFRVQFVKPHVRNPKTNQQTPAMSLGIVENPLQFHEFFDLKITLKQTQLNPEWESYYLEQPKFERSQAWAKKAA